jgi:hypothetical protein
MYVAAILGNGCINLTTHLKHGVKSVWQCVECKLYNELGWKFWCSNNLDGNLWQIADLSPGEYNLRPHLVFEGEKYQRKEVVVHVLPKVIHLP